MTAMPDKGIWEIAYNYLNLPTQMNINEGGFTDITVKTFYSADGTKLKKENTTVTTGISTTATSISTTDYLDGFQYLSSNVLTAAPEGEELGLASKVAMEREAFVPETLAAAAVVAPPGGGTDNSVLQFFPTAEGFYDFVRNKYIYQYKDHLGNTRLSFMKNSAGVLQVLDKNDYYPFGMNHLDPNTASFFGNSSYKNYKFLGEELQETGFYDLNARFYMPDAVIFGQHDPLSEKTLQPYAYGFNNPIRYKDPTGLSGTDWVHNRSTNSVYWNENAKSQATAGANETYLGTSGTYTTQDGSTTALGPGGSNDYTNNSLLGGLGIMNNLDPLIQAGDAAPLMSALVFGHNDGSYIRETPASNSSELAMGNPSGRLAVAGLYGLQGGTAEIAASKALGGLANFIAFGKGAGRVFWSGGDAAKNAAAEFAIANGGTTLEMRPVGKALEYITDRTSYDYMKPFWDYTSYNYARGTKGTVNAFQNASTGVRIKSVWGQIEYPVLNGRNPIIYHNVTIP